MSNSIKQEALEICIKYLLLIASGQIECAETKNGGIAGNAYEIAMARTAIQKLEDLMKLEKVN